MQLCLTFAGARMPLLAGGGQQDLDRAVAERDLVIRRWRRARSVLA
jgi:hypothetical protein